MTERAQHDPDSPKKPSPTQVAGSPLLREARQHLVRAHEPVLATVRASRICTRSQKSAAWVRHIEIDVSGTPLEGSWVSGQSFGVIPPGQDPNGNPHKLRLYSIASPTKGETGDGTILATTTKRLIDEGWDNHELFLGVCSNYLCDLDEGAPITITGPVGKRFVLPEDPSKHDYLFISTGTGIAPFRGMLGDLSELGMPSKATLITGAPYESDILYFDEFMALRDRFGDRFTYLPTISRHSTPAQTDPMYVQDRMKLESEQLLPFLKSERTLIYICGVAGMELGIIQALAGILDPVSLGQYVLVDPSIPSDPEGWERTMIPRKLKPTKRLMLEVY